MSKETFLPLVYAIIVVSFMLVLIQPTWINKVLKPNHHYVSQVELTYSSGVKDTITLEYMNYRKNKAEIYTDGWGGKCFYFRFNQGESKVLGCNGLSNAIIINTK